MDSIETLFIHNIIDDQLSKPDHFPCLETETGAGIIFIGLGGIGCSTVRRIKQLYTKRFQHSDNVNFLAIDSDKATLQGLRRRGEGALDESEIFELFTDDVLRSAENVPYEAFLWCDHTPPLPQQIGQSARCNRQAGRFMLCATENYDKIRRKLSGIIFDMHAAANSKIRIYLIAGLYGGTGSGIFVDMAYMVRSIFNNVSTAFADMSLYGVAYLPDEYETDMGVPAEVRSMLYKNTYAALKELDHFMSLRKNSPLEYGYRLKVPVTGDIWVDGPVFDEGCMMLISPPEGVQSEKVLVSNVANSILMMGAQLDGVAASFIDDYTHLQLPGELSLKMRDRLNVEKQKKSPWLKHMALTRTGYISPAYGIMDALCDEIRAYCANRFFNSLNDKWDERAKMIDAREVAQLCSLTAPDAMVNKFKQELFNRVRVIELDESDPLYPQFGLFSKKPNVLKILGFLEARAEYNFEKCQPTLSTFVQCFVLNFKMELSEKIASTDMLAAIGPKNIMKNLIMMEDLIRYSLDAEGYWLARIHDCRLHIDSMDNEVGNSGFVKSPKIKALISLCEEYANVIFDKMIYDTVSKKLMTQLHQTIEELRREYEPFEICQTGIEHHFVMASRELKQNVSTYKNIYGAGDVEGNKERLLEFIDNWADTIDVEQLCWKKRELELIVNTKDNSLDYTMAAQLAGMKINRLTAPLVRRTEALALIAFDEDKKIKRLKEIDEATDRYFLSWSSWRNNLVPRVAEYIIKNLEDRLNPQPGYAAGNFEGFRRGMLIAVPEGWENIVSGIRTLAPDATVCKSKESGLVACVRLSVPMELFRLAPIRKWAAEYAYSDWDTLHLDTGVNDWKTYLPEICGSDAVACYNDWGVDATMLEKLVEKDWAMHDKIASEFDFCLKNNLLRKTAGTQGLAYTMCSVCENPMMVRLMSDRLQSVLPKGMMDPEVEDALRAVVKTFDAACVSGELGADPHLDGTDFLAKDEENLYRLIRSDMRYTRLILGARSGKDAVDELKSLIGI